jgi:DNA-binding transcriptional regulator YiaG
MTKEKSMSTKKRRLADVLLKNLTEFRDDLRAGVDIGQKYTARTICLDFSPRDYDAEMVRATREKFNVSQAVFAAILNVSIDTVQAWEQDVNKPEGAVCRLLDLMNADPAIVSGMIRRGEKHAEPQTI